MGVAKRKHSVAKSKQKGRKKTAKAKTRKVLVRPVSKKLGRPEKQFTRYQITKIGKLAFQGCQNRTIATIIGCEHHTLKKHFYPLLSKKRAERKAWLRDVQCVRAVKDSSSAMIIFLGKNELDQVDKHEVGGTDGGPIEFNVNVTKTYKKNDES